LGHLQAFLTFDPPELSSVWDFGDK
jgi:hypothetical protein